MSAVQQMLVAGGGDPFYNNVSLLLHFDGANGSTTFTDNSPSPKTVTANGTAQISTTQSKFGGASAFFAGTGTPGWASTPSNTDFIFGIDNFTIEGWLYLAGGASGTVFDNRTSSTSLHPVLILANGGTGANDRISFYVAGFYPIISDVVTLLNVWTHIALCRGAALTRLFVNGVQSGLTYADTNNYATSGVVLTGAGLGQSNALNGYIDDFRVTKGVARYTSNFTPPAAPFPNY